MQVVIKQKHILMGGIALGAVFFIVSFWHAGPVTTKAPVVSAPASIAKGQTYLKNNFAEITPIKRLILDYLQRKYSLDAKFSAAVSPILPPVPGDFDDPQQFPVFKRIAYPNDLVTSLPSAEGDPQSQMMMDALYCDRIDLPADFDKLIQTNIDLGGYNLTHVIFSLQRMRENGCQYFTPVEEQKIRDEVATGMVKLVQTESTIPDMRYESIAFLLDMGRRDLVPKSWIDQIVSDQQPSGGWKVRLSDKTSNDHATVLALWALLGYSRPNASPVPMIQQPS